MGRIRAAARLRPRPEGGFAHWHAYENPLPEFPAFTHINEAVCTASHVLVPHAHPQLEICYIHAGRAEWRCNGERFPLGPGDFYISRPGEVHQGRPDPDDPNHNFAVGFDPAQLTIGRGALAPPAPRATDAAAGAADACDLMAGGGGVFARVIPGGQGAETICRRILAELDRLPPLPSPRRPLARAQIEALLVELLILVTRCALDWHEARAAAPARLPRAAFRRLMRELEAHLDHPPSLAAMAAMAGLSTTHFAVAFRREVGASPLEYLTRERLAAAATRLRRGTSVTAAALALGFSSPQYFSVLFKRRYGATPSAWARQEAV